MSLSSIALAAVPALAFLVAGFLVFSAKTSRLIDVPNERSSHVIPTPRGGGLGVWLGFLSGIAILWVEGGIGGGTASAYLVAPSLVALVGMADDIWGVAVRWRLLVHFGAVSLGLMLLGAGAPLLQEWWFFSPFLVIALVWFLNLYNFMDGIDGIATTEAITVCLGMACLAWGVGRTDLALAPAVLALAASGFLPWNVPPARIFMGDVGSGFIGCALGLMFVQQAVGDPALLAACVILPAVFVTDASLTLFRRMIAGYPLHQAHRTHAYQHASRRLGSHGRVTAAVLVINVAWLFPLAAWALQGDGRAWMGLALAYGPLSVLAWWLGAGRDV